MTVSYTCDWCGEPIESDRGAEYGEAHLSATGLHEDYGLAYKEVGHFHAGRFRAEDSCLMQAIRLVKERFGTMPGPAENPAEQFVRGPNREVVDEYGERRDEWKRTPMACKEGLIIEAFGDAQLTVRDLTERINEKLGWQTNSCLYRSSVESLVRRLLDSGQLDRDRDGWWRGRSVYRYSRKRDLTGPIVDLERAFHDGETEA